MGRTTRRSDRAAVYVDKILEGAKPGDLPVEAMTELELVINEEVARELGLKLSRQWLDQADEVIDHVSTRRRRPVVTDPAQ